MVKTRPRMNLIDPTGTSGLRRVFNAELRRQFSGLKLDLVRYFSQPDLLIDAESFSHWLQSRLQERFTGPRQERLWTLLVEESFRRGVGRAYDDVVPRSFSKGKMDFDQGSRKGFVTAVTGAGMTPLELPDEVTANVFCPTGEGGGVDPTCSPMTTKLDINVVQEPKFIRVDSRVRGGTSKEEIKVGVNQPISMVDVSIQSNRESRGWGKGLIYKGNVYTWPESESEASHHGGVAEALGLPVSKYGEEGYRKLFFKRGEGGVIVSVQSQADLTTVSDRYKGSVVTINALANNAFFSRARTALSSVGLLVQRAWTEFVGGVQGLANGLTKTLIDGVQKNANPRRVASEMVRQVERQRVQSGATASDSVVRAFNEGQLEAFPSFGVTEVGVAVEWRVRREKNGSIAKNVCKACRDLEGVVLKASEAKGLFPRHPRCACSLVAVKSVKKNSKTSRGSVAAAIQRSRRRYKSEAARRWSVGVKIAKRRPKVVVTRNVGDVLVDRIDRLLGNVFCPTGPGGGVDPFLKDSYDA